MSKAVYVQRRSDGLTKLTTYLTGEKIPFNRNYNASVLLWLVSIEVVGDLGEWNLRRVIDIVNQHDLRIEYKNKCLVIFV